MNILIGCVILVFSLMVGYAVLNLVLLIGMAIVMGIGWVCMQVWKQFRRVK